MMIAFAMPRKRMNGPSLTVALKQQYGNTESLLFASKVKYITIRPLLMGHRKGNDKCDFA